MEITFKAIGVLRQFFPGQKAEIKLKIEDGLAIKTILVRKLHIDPDKVMTVMVNGKYVNKDYIPGDGDIIILMDPLIGG